MTITQKIIIPIAVIVGLSLIRCGSNVYDVIDPKDPAEEAAVALEDQKPEIAIKVLEKALRKEPENPTYLSLLASAKAQLAGIDTILLALKLISTSDNNQEQSQDETNADKNDIEQLFDIMPPASLETIGLLSEAVTLMGMIADEDLLASDRFKLSMFFTSLMTLRTKLLDLDGDGKLSPEELLFLNNEMAAAILTDLIAAEGSFTASDEESSDGEAVAKISSIRSKIDSQEGADDTERLRNFLAT